METVRGRAGSLCLSGALGCCLILFASLSSAESPGAPEGLAAALRNLSGTGMHQTVVELSRPEFQGRQTGTNEDRSSAALLTDHFSRLGLSPATEQSLTAQPAQLPFVDAIPINVVRIEAAPRITVATVTETLNTRHGPDFLPVLDSPPVKTTAPVVFVGYGIADAARGLDEYAGLDVRDRVVLFLRGKPDRYPIPVSHADKERAARERGAVAYLMATGPIISAYEARRGTTGAPSGAYGQSAGERPIPGAWISTELAERILAEPGQSLRARQEVLNKEFRPQSRATSAQVSMSWESAQEAGALHNVLGLIPGQGPSASETIIIGAHRDHLGRQGPLIFPGADDNASGTAVILEVAKLLRELGAPPKRSLLFLSFSGEEQGLLGSRRYVAHPSRPLRSTIAMINIDHAGVGNGRLTVGVTGLPKEQAQAAGQRAGLADKLDLFGFFPGGDHVPFKEAGVPTVTIVTSGPHPDFHRPTDTSDKVQPALLELAARYVLALVWQLGYE